jgi:sodium-dependent dicarboxylate transporter 2/3/5
MRHLKTLGLILGPGLALVVTLLPQPDGLTLEGQRGLAILVFCVFWWLLTPVALPVTSLIGLALLPLLGVLPPEQAFALFGNQAVFFVIGVFLVAAAMMRTGLSTRLALWVMRWMSRSEDMLAAAVLLMSTVLCFVVVSHAVAALMLPIVIGVIEALDLGPRSRTARRLVLSMAWGTVVGSNLTLFASARASLALQVYGTHMKGMGVDAPSVGFLEFSAATMGICIVLLGLTWVVLRLSLAPEGLDMKPAVVRLNARVRELGPVSLAEWKTLAVVLFMLPALVIWGETYGLGTVAVAFSCSLFALGVLEWETAQRDVNWGIVLLYGGAIAIGAGLARSGAMNWVAEAILPAAGTHPVISLTVIVSLGMFFTTFVANAAVIALVLPAMLISAPGLRLDPVAVTVAMSVATGIAFSLPVSTPAIAMAWGTGYVRTRDGFGLGVLLSVLSVPVVVLVAVFVWPLIGLDPFLH